MASFDQESADCVVYVYREGIAAAVGHDLAIEVTDFGVDVAEDGSKIEAEFAADSLRVRHAMDDGQPQPAKLSGRDKKKIERNIRKDVLETKHHPEITFRSTEVSGRDGSLHIRGVLRLHGVEREISFAATHEDEVTRARLRLEQPDFDIEPYSALLGALKLKPEIDVEIEVPHVISEPDASS